MSPQFGSFESVAESYITRMIYQIKVKTCSIAADPILTSDLEVKWVNELFENLIYFFKYFFYWV